jgi:hypothetical protein
MTHAKVRSPRHPSTHRTVRRQVQRATQTPVRPRVLSAANLAVQPQPQAATLPQDRLRLQSSNHPDSHPRGDPALPPPFRLTHDDSSGYRILAKTTHEIEQSHAWYRSQHVGRKGKNEQEEMTRKFGWNPAGHRSGLQTKRPEDAPAAVRFRPPARRLRIRTVHTPRFPRPCPARPRKGSGGDRSPRRSV